MSKKTVCFRLGELFSGPGGIGLGAKMATPFQTNDKIYTIDHVFANDIDPFACETYKNNLKNGCPLTIHVGDVKNLEFDNIPDLDALTFGFPCNDFSIVGEHKGFQGEYGGLYTYGKKALDVKKPKWFLAENVGGLQSANEGKAFSKIITDLQSSGNGYNITVHLYKFEEYGIPQCRHRIVIVGIDKSLGLTFKVPAPTTNTPKLMKSAKETITVPPIPIDAPNHEFTRQSSQVVERLKHIPEGENAWYPGLPKEHRLKVKGAKLSQIYKRLTSDKPSYTVTGSGGGGTHCYHWKENRALTNRERARLQTFPDDFIFYGSKEQVRKQVGMAVPPLAAKILIESIFKTFSGEKYESIDPKWDVINSDCC